jgi:hypothetical protein
MVYWGGDTPERDTDATVALWGAVDATWATGDDWTEPKQGVVAALRDKGLSQPAAMLAASTQAAIKSKSQTSGSAADARRERDERMRVKIASYGGRKLNSREKGELCDHFEVKSWDTIRRALKK